MIHTMDGAEVWLVRLRIHPVDMDFVRNGLAHALITSFRRFTWIRMSSSSISGLVSNAVGAKGFDLAVAMSLAISEAIVVGLKEGSDAAVIDSCPPPPSCSIPATSSFAFDGV